VLAKFWIGTVQSSKKSGGRTWRREVRPQVRQVQPSNGREHACDARIADRVVDMMIGVMV